MIQLGAFVMSLHEQEYFKALRDEGQSWKGSSFRNCLFESCYFFETNWRQTQFIDCVFKNCNMSLVKMEGCRLHHVQFKECKLIGIDFFKCEQPFFSLYFDKTFLQTCNFADLNLKKTCFQACKLREVYFSHTDLSESNFTYADLQDTIFHHCNLSQADFTHAKNYFIDLQSNQVKNAKFSFPEVVHLLKSFEIQIVNFN